MPRPSVITQENWTTLCRYAPALSRGQRRAVADFLAMNSLAAAIEKYKKLDNKIFTLQERDAAVGIARILAPYYPTPRDGHIPREVTAIVSALQEVVT